MKNRGWAKGKPRARKKRLAWEAKHEAHLALVPADQAEGAGTDEIHHAAHESGDESSIALDQTLRSVNGGKTPRGSPLTLPEDVGRLPSPQRKKRGRPSSAPIAVKASKRKLQRGRTKSRSPNFDHDGSAGSFEGGLPRTRTDQHNEYVPDEPAPSTPPPIHTAKRVRTDSQLKRDQNFVIDMPSDVEDRGAHYPSSDSVSYSPSEVGTQTDDDSVAGGGGAGNALPKGSDHNEDGNVDYCDSCGLIGELVCCEKCPRAFHHSCLKGQDSESLPEKWECHQCVKERTSVAEDIVDGEKIQHIINATFDDWQEQNDSRLFTILGRIHAMIERLMSYDFGYMFKKPVEACNKIYHELIKKPMDLGTILEKLVNSHNGYSSQSNLQLFEIILEVLNDIKTVWDNCYFFNKEGSCIYRMASVQHNKYKHIMDQSIMPLLLENELPYVEPFR